MGVLYSTLVLATIALFIINIVFIVESLIYWGTYGLQTVLGGLNLVERIFSSTYLKWILFADIIWLILVTSFLVKRKNYRTNENLNYLSSNIISEPSICVIIPTYNEEMVIESVVKDYLNQEYVKYVLVIDNHSSDKTIEIAERCGARVIKKEKNMGYAHSCVMGLKESLKTSANIIVLTEADGTFSARDLSKMIPYLENSDMVIGTRQIQVLSEKGNQNKMMYVWGNFLLAKLLQIKYFSLLHMGVVILTDVGCSYRCMRKEALEKIMPQFTKPNFEVIVKPHSGLFALFMTELGIKNDLKLVEVPITFKRRVGISKTQSDKKIKAIKYGLEFFWFIIRN